MVPRTFDKLPFEDATAWGLSLYRELARLKGQVPFSVVYDWQATCVLQFWTESLKKRRFDEATMAQKLSDVAAVQALHRKHLEGGAAPKAEWREALRKVYRGWRAYAYADADAYAYAYADADADAYAYADADAYAYADADAYAYADADADACAHDREAVYERRRRENLKPLANGLVEALSRVPTPEA
jgi:hypothetical protein